MAYTNAEMSEGAGPPLRKAKVQSSGSIFTFFLSGMTVLFMYLFHAAICIIHRRQLI